MPVIDASVMISAINRDELGHSQSRDWLGDALLSGQQVSAPIVILAEVGAALSRELALAQQALSLLSQGTIIRLYPVSLELGQAAAVIASEHRIRGCDAVYVALARQLDTELVTLDRQQLERGASVVQTRRP